MGPGPDPQARHVGDLGNIVVGEEGVAEVAITDHQASLQGHHSVLGRPIVIHAGAQAEWTNSFLTTRPPWPRAQKNGEDGKESPRTEPNLMDSLVPKQRITDGQTERQRDRQTDRWTGK